MKWVILMLSMSLVARAHAAPKPSPKLRPLKIGTHTLEVEIADNEQARAQGLMNRQSLEENRGMLFIFEQPAPLAFWMKNTFIPLSIGFFDKDKKLLNILDMKPAASLMASDQDLPRYTSQGPALYALEVKQGWFARRKIKIGERFALLPADGPKLSPLKKAPDNGPGR